MENDTCSVDMLIWMCISFPEPKTGRKSQCLLIVRVNNESLGSAYHFRNRKLEALEVYTVWGFKAQGLGSYTSFRTDGSGPATFESPFVLVVRPSVNGGFKAIFCSRGATCFCCQ